MSTYSNDIFNFNSNDPKSETELNEIIRILNDNNPFQKNVLDDILSLDVNSETYLYDISKYSFDNIDMSNPLNKIKLDMIILKNKMKPYLSLEKFLDKIVIIENWKSDNGIVLKKGYELNTINFINLDLEGKKKVVELLIDENILESDMYLNLMDDLNFKIEKFKQKMDACVAKEDFELAIIYRNKIKELENINI